MNRHERRKSLSMDGREIRTSLHRMRPPDYRMQLFGRELDELKGAVCASCGASQGASRTALTWADAEAKTLFYTFAVACKRCLGDRQKVSELATRLVVDPLRASREIDGALHKMLPSGYQMKRYGPELYQLDMRGATCAVCGTSDGISRTSVTWTESETKTLFYAYAIACELCLGDQPKVDALARRMIVQSLQASRRSAAT